MSVHLTWPLTPSRETLPSRWGVGYRDGDGTVKVGYEGWVGSQRQVPTSLHLWGGSFQRVPNIYEGPHVIRASGRGPQKRLGPRVARRSSPTKPYLCVSEKGHVLLVPHSTIYTIKVISTCINVRSSTVERSITVLPSPLNGLKTLYTHHNKLRI